MPNDFAIIKDALSRIGTINDLETENAKLRKVADAARAYLKSDYNETLDELVLTVLELDKEGE